MTRIVGNTPFHFQPVASETEGLRLQVDAPGEYEPLCRVVETAWLYGPTRLLESVQNQTGQSFEGVAAYAYHHEDPHELEPGVNLSYMDRDQVVDPQFFRDYVVTYARTVMEAARAQAIELSWPNQLSPSLRQLLAS